MKPIIDLNDAILRAVARTEPVTFAEFCHNLGDACPQKEDRSGWRDLLEHIKDLDRLRYILVKREHEGAHLIQTLELDNNGREYIRDRLDQERGLFQVMP